MDKRIAVVKGDITCMQVDAIVNAANSSLVGGGGVDGAIHRAAGPKLLEECRCLHGCQTGEAKITHGYELKAKWVIHTVGPIWHGGGAREEDLLASCYRNVLKLAEEKGIATIAFPSISTGAYRFPLQSAVNIAVHEVSTFLSLDNQLQKIYFVCYDDRTYQAYRERLDVLETTS